MKLTLPDVPKSEQTPLVTELLGIIAQLIEQVQFQQEQISQLKDEIRVLKGQKKRPEIKPSKLDALTTADEQTAPAAKKSSATVKKKVHRVFPGKAALIFRKKYSESRNP